MKRRLLRFAVLPVLLVLALLIWRAYLGTTINRQLRLLRTAGLPVNGEELNRWYTAVPDAQNAALVLTQAFALRVNYPDSRSNLILNFKLPQRGALLTPEQAELLRGYVSLNEERLKKADEALKLSACRYPIDCSLLMYTPLPHLAWLKDICELHQYAALLSLTSGNVSAASSNIVTILALARTLEHEPAVISQYVRTKLISLAFATLEHRAGGSTFSSDEIARLRSAFEQADPAGMAVIGLIGERALTTPYFTISQAEVARIRPPDQSAEPEQNSPLPCYGPAILRLLGYYQLDYGSYLIGMNKALMLLSNPPPFNLRAGGYFAGAGEGSKKRHRTMSAQVFTSYIGIAARENEGIAQQRLALTALAVEGFRDKRGRLPETLAELIPEFMEAVPEDPFTGLDLDFKRRESGYVIYSFGRDREDNNGLEQAEKKQADDQKSYDITFTVDR